MLIDDFDALAVTDRIAHRAHRAEGGQDGGDVGDVLVGS